MIFDRQLGSRYVLGPLLGSGSMGRVYHAKRLADGERLAVKVLREDWSDDDEVVLRFLREKRVLASLDNPHVVKVFDLVIEGGHAGIVMELITGGDLRQLIRRGPMTGAQVAALGRQLALALDAAHTARILHGDVKPENVLVAATDPELIVKLGDFGIARLAGGAPAGNGEQIGTPAYLAPEPAGPAGDVYALGILLYEALTGRLPFPGGWAAGRRAELSRPVEISDPWWALLQQMLAEAAGGRPSAAGVAAALAGHRPEPDQPPTVAGLATVLKPRKPDGPAAAGRRPGLRRVAVGGAAAALLLLVLGSVAWAGGLLSTSADGERTIPAPPASASSPVTTTVPTTAPAAAPSVSPSGSTTHSRSPGPVVAQNRPPAATTPPHPSPAASATPDTTAQCRAASHAGGLDIGVELAVSGGPNFVPQPCHDIWLKLTEVHFITYARACMEDAGGTEIRCGGWVFLEDNGRWNKLLAGVSGGQRWKLDLKADGQGRVGFQFSG